MRTGNVYNRGVSPITGTVVFA
ncbi:hypothetical protein E4659_03880 [Dickeya dianthicola]|uniref:Uncharacterized protein n=1 Tax=Dickeya dianthicola TaxID=204039 RepID=A0AAX1C9V8_9GAMM|nr:hypothetical protein [Dickeya dianthicola]MBQ4796693.1 hypothetical protein [Pectobacterium versatile]MBI0451324.1 hypothetical protein [Dickeya dianthicola]MBI0455177.1 hypothetical protein [Dickeya dianthicola]MBI0460072.1 hypothetical protein [Dickeya dianthicola]